jgi:hypothetical protein
MSDIPAVLASLICIAAVACGGSIDAGEPSDAATVGSASVDGTIQGQPIPTTTTAALFDGSGAVLIVLDNLEDACSLWQAGRGNRPGLQVFTLAAVAGTNPLAPGSYAVEPSAPSPTTYANATYYTSDDNCQQTSLTEAASGTVNVQTVSPSLVTGNFDVTLYTGDRIRGTFSAPVCDTPVALDAIPPCERD